MTTPLLMVLIITIFRMVILTRVAITVVAYSSGDDLVLSMLLVLMLSMLAAL